jgi:carbamoyl-phosphate synthase large subunit
MRSTGEVLGLADSFGMAFYKAQDAAKATLPTQGTVLLTINAQHRGPDVEKAARRFVELGFKILATTGTRAFLESKGIAANLVRKVHEGRPNVEDAVKNGEIQLVINTPAGKFGVTDDSYIRKAAIRHKIPYITTVAAACAAVEGIAARRAGDPVVRSLQEYHAAIRRT